jgi:hypothetical protein
MFFEKLTSHHDTSLQSLSDLRAHIPKEVAEELLNLD